MKIVYLVSMYPCLSETFIAREMIQLQEFGNEIVIGRLKPQFLKIFKSMNDKGIILENSKIISTSNFFSYFYGLIWGIKTRRNKVVSNWQDIWKSAETPINTLKLLVIFLSSLNIARKIESLNVQHIRSNFLHSESIAAMWVSNLLDIPYSITIHTTKIPFNIHLIKKVVTQAKFCAGISVYVINFAKTNFRNCDKFHLIRNGINIKNLQSHYNENYEKGFNIISVGRLIDKKGFDTLIMACQDIVAKGYNIQCTIVGDGEEKKKLLKLISKLQIDHFVRLVGSLSFENVKLLFEKSYLLVMPCRISHKDKDEDGIPTTIIEAMAMKIPVISTPIGGIPEIIINKSTGLLVRSDDFLELANSIVELFENHEFTASLIRNAEKKIEFEYNLNKNCAKLLFLINQ